MTYYSIPPSSDELYHYGIKGMKWGVRRYQNEDGSLTPAGEKHYGRSQQSFNRALLDRHRNYEKTNQEYTKRIQRLKKRYGVPEDTASYEEQKNFWTNTKSKKYLKKADAIDERYRKKDRRAYEKDQKVERKNWKDVEKNKEFNNAFRSAKDTMRKMEDMENRIAGRDSVAYKNAYKKYVKQMQKYRKDYDGNDDGWNDNLSYGFDHYRWREGGSDYDKAYSKYKKSSANLQSQLNTQLNSILKKGLDNQNLSKDKMDTARFLLDQRIRYRFDENNKKKRK